MAILKMEKIRRFWTFLGFLAHCARLRQNSFTAHQQPFENRQVRYSKCFYKFFFTTLRGGKEVYHSFMMIWNASFFKTGRKNGKCFLVKVHHANLTPNLCPELICNMKQFLPTDFNIVPCFSTFNCISGNKLKVLTLPCYARILPW